MYKNKLVRRARGTRDRACRAGYSYIGGCNEFEYLPRLFRGNAPLFRFLPCIRWRYESQSVTFSFLSLSISYTERSTYKTNAYTCVFESCFSRRTTIRHETVKLRGYRVRISPDTSGKEMEMKFEIRGVLKKLLRHSRAGTRIVLPDVYIRVYSNGMVALR